MHSAYLHVAVLAGPKKGALVYPKRPFRGIRKRRQFPLRHPQQTDQFVADQAAVKREEHRQEKARPQAIHKACLGQEHQDENAKCRHGEFCDREKHCAVSHNGVHERIRLDHPPIHELEGQESIGTGQQHDSGCKEKQPGVVPVQENDVAIRYAAMCMAARQRKAVHDGTP